MTDREKIIRALECCTGYCCEEIGCPYFDTEDDCEEKWRDDAIAFLKAQEPVEPKMMYFVDEGLTWETYEVPTCGVCGALLGDALFCPNCGRAVKRNDKT